MQRSSSSFFRYGALGLVVGLAGWLAGCGEMENDAATIPVGLVVLARGGQRFQCLRIEDRSLHDGRTVTLAVYRTKCRGCQSPMEVSGWARLVDPARLTKSCPDCRSGGPL